MKNAGIIDHKESTGRQDNKFCFLAIVAGVVFTVTAVCQFRNITACFRDTQHDLRAYIAAAHNLRAHRDIYTTHHQPLPEDPSLTANIPRYIYPPLFSILFLPSTLLSYDTFKHIWFFANLLFVFHGLYLLVGVLRWRWRLRMVIFLICASIVVSSEALHWLLLTAQADGCVFYMVALSYALFEKRRYGVAGAVIAIAAWCKLTPGLVALYMLFHGNRRYLVSFILAGILLALFQIAIAGKCFYEFFTMVLPEILHWTSPVPDVQSTWSLALLLAQTFRIQALSCWLYLAILIVIIVSVVSVLFRRMPGAAERYYGFAICSMAAVLLPKLSWMMAFVCTITGLVGIAFALVETRRPLLMWPSTIVIAFLYSNVPFYIPFTRTHAFTAPLLLGRAGFATLACLVLLAVLTHVARSKKLSDQI